jgi:hypothetical protein
MINPLLPYFSMHVHAHCVWLYYVVLMWLCVPAGLARVCVSLPAVWHAVVLAAPFLCACSCGMVVGCVFCVPGAHVSEHQCVVPGSNLLWQLAGVAGYVPPLC